MRQRQQRLQDPRTFRGSVCVARVIVVGAAGPQDKSHGFTGALKPSFRSWHSAGTSIASSSCPSNLSRGLVFPSFPLSVLTSLIAFVSFPFLMAGFSGRTFGSASATSRSVSLCILSSGIGAKASRFEAALAALARDLSLPFESFFQKIVAGWLKAIVAKTLDRADFHIFPPKTDASDEAWFCNGRSLKGGGSCPETFGLRDSFPQHTTTSVPSLKGELLN